MGTIASSKNVKLIIGVISGFNKLFDNVEDDLISRFGSIDYERGLIQFTFTDYYKYEMGSGLLRKFFSFERLIQPDDIADIKRTTNELEGGYSASNKFSVKRPINIDPGYLELSKLVLASTKDFSHRIYLRNGIYAEVTLLYKKGDFCSLEWTYPDYKTKEYICFFQKVRAIYEQQLKK